ncbi:MAG: type III-B CRISPR module-associated Cmr3 family protein [Saprospiraceae bacterium]
MKKMDNMELTIQPLDTLFFRDGKPFARGDETWADSTFPPNPSVIYGAMRTALATVEGKEIPFGDVPERLGTENFSIKNIYYRIDKKNYLPLPLDFVEYKSRRAELIEKKFHEVHLLDVSERKSIISEKNPLLNTSCIQRIFKLLKI